ncbi:MAG: four helix bundle protein [Ignavibacteriales bacterium]|nr:four helix bundle protein [Ignavibacteriales bacterium]
MNQRAIDLEARLIQFAVRVIAIAESLPVTKAGNHLANQLVRSGTSPALNYGEAQDAESKADFIHKLKIVTKELRETRVSLQIVELMASADSTDNLRKSSDECNQLISIFVKSIRTSRGDGRYPATSSLTISD